MDHFYFSCRWEGLVDGTEVVVNGNTLTIGVDAFARPYDAVLAGIAVYGDYASTINVDWDLVSPDIYANSEWEGGTPGDEMYLEVVNPDDITEVYENAIKLVFGTNATDSRANALTLYNSTDMSGVIHFIGGTVSTVEGTTSDTATLNSRPAVIEDSHVATLWGATLNPWSNSEVSLTVINSTVTSYLFIGSRSGSFNATYGVGTVRNSTVQNFCYSQATASVDTVGIMNIENSTVHYVGPYGYYYGDLTINITGSNIDYVSAAGAAEARVTGTSHINLIGNNSIGTLGVNCGYEVNGTVKKSRVIDAAYLHVSGGTTYVSNRFEIAAQGGTAYSVPGPVYITIDADSALVYTGGTSTAIVGQSVDISFTVNVDGYTPASASKLVFSGKDLSSYTNINWSITGDGAEDYYLSVTNSGVYLNATPAFISARWKGLTPGETVSTPAGTATLGAGAFSTYNEAVAAGEEFISVLDVYLNSDYTDSTPIVVDGYTATYGVDAFSVLNDATAAWRASDKYGALYITGGTLTASTSMTDSSGAKQFLTGATTVIEDTLISFISGGTGGSGNVATTSDITVRGSTITGGITNGNRLYGTLTDGKMLIEDSLVNIVYVATHAVDGTASVTVNGGSVGTMTTGSNVNAGSEIVFTVNGGTVRYLGSAGTQNANRTEGNVTFNVANATMTKFFADHGIDTSGNHKDSYVTGNVTVNVSGGGTTNVSIFQVDGDCASATININADSCLRVTSTCIIAETTAFTINVDGYTPASESKLVFYGKNLSAHSVSIVGEGAQNYYTSVSGNNLYLKLKSAYYTVAWEGLESGTVVDISGGTAVIGTDAFASYTLAAASGLLPVSLDTYAYVGATAGTEIVVDGGTYTIGTAPAYNTVAGARDGQSGYGVIRVVGGSVTTGRTWFNNKRAILTDYNDSSVGSSSGGIVAAASSGTVANIDFTVGNGAYVHSLWGARGGTAENINLTVLAGGSVANLYGGYSGSNMYNSTLTVRGKVGYISGGNGNCQFHDGYTTRIVIDGGSANNVFMGNTNTAGASQMQGSFEVNVIDGIVGGTIGFCTGGTITNGGDFAIDISGSTVNLIQYNNNANVNVNSISITAVNSSINRFIGYQLKSIVEDYDMSFTNVAIGATAYTRCVGGTIGGDVNLTFKDVTFNNNGLMLVSDNTTTYVGGNFTATIDHITGVNALNASKYTIDGNYSVSFANMNANYGTYLASSAASVGGNVTVNLSSSTFSTGLYFYTLASAHDFSEDVTGDININITGGTVDMNEIEYFTTYGLNIAEGATFLYRGSRTFDLISVVNNGTFVINRAAAATALNNEQTFVFAHDFTNNGTVQATGYTGNAAAATDSSGNTFIYTTEHNTVYVDSAFSEYALYDTLTYQGKTLRKGINAFETIGDVANLSAFGVAKLYQQSSSESVYASGVSVEFDGGSFTQNVYGGARVTSAGSVEDSSKIVVSDGTFRGLVAGQRLEAGSTVSSNSALEISGGSVKAVFGGHYLASGASTISGDTEAEITGGTFSSFVCGGNVVATGGSVTLSGASTLTISGGTFNGAVAGGSDSQGGLITTTNGYNSNLVISGGVFNSDIYGGNVASRPEYAALSGVEETLIDINGSTSITIDTSANSVSISGCIVAGSYGSGQVTGNTSITFTGLGSNLDFTGKLSGDSKNAGTYEKRVSGTRSLVFDNFVGSFSGDIRGIDSVTLSSGSNVVFDRMEWYLKYANEWNFGAGTSLSWTNGTNDFSGDTMNLTFNELDSDWTIFTGTASTLANFDDMSVSFNGGASLSYDEGVSGYSDGSYLLTVDSENSVMKLAKLA